jgi:hypothetical protein
MKAKPKKLYKESMKQKVGSLKRLTIEKQLGNMTKWRKEKTKINKMRDELGDIMANTNEIQRIIRKNFQSIYSSKVENLEKMDKFLAANHN